MSEDELKALPAGSRVRTAPRRIFTKTEAGYWLRSGTTGDWKTSGEVAAEIEKGKP